MGETENVKETMFHHWLEFGALTHFSLSKFSFCAQGQVKGVQREQDELDPVITKFGQAAGALGQNSDLCRFKPVKGKLSQQVLK